MVLRLILIATLFARFTAFAETAPPRAGDLAMQFQAFYMRSRTGSQLLRNLKDHLPEAAMNELKDQMRGSGDFELPPLIVKKSELVFQKGKAKITMVLGDLSKGEFNLNGHTLSCGHATNLKPCFAAVTKVLKAPKKDFAGGLSLIPEAFAGEEELAEAILVGGALVAICTYGYAKHAYDSHVAPACGGQIVDLKERLKKINAVMTSACNEYSKPDMVFTVEKEGVRHTYHMEKDSEFTDSTDRPLEERTLKYNQVQMTEYNETIQPANAPVSVPGVHMTMQTANGPDFLVKKTSEYEDVRSLVKYAYDHYSCGKCGEQMRQQLIGWRPEADKPAARAGGGTGTHDE